MSPRGTCTLGLGLMLALAGLCGCSSNNRPTPGSPGKTVTVKAAPSGQPIASAAVATTEQAAPGTGDATQPTAPRESYIGSFTDHADGRVVTNVWVGDHTRPGASTPYDPSAVPGLGSGVIYDGCGQRLVTYSDSTTYIPFRMSVAFSGVVRTNVHVQLVPTVRGAEVAIAGPDDTWVCGLNVTMSPGEHDSYSGWIALEAISNKHPHLTRADMNQWAFDGGPTSDESGSGTDQAVAGPNARVFNDDTYGRTGLLGFYAKPTKIEWDSGRV